MTSDIDMVSREWRMIDVDMSASSQPEGIVRSKALSLRVKMLVGLMRAGAKLGTARLGGLVLKTQVDGCNPAPLPGLSFEPLFLAGVEDLQVGQRVLDMGTGCGVWALLASRTGAQVTASDLPGISLTIVTQNAKRNGVPVPQLTSGDLFESLDGQRFDRILFNPPFHVGQKTRPSDAAYMGGADGGVVRRFLRTVSAHLEPAGTVCIILPTIELKQYANAFDGFEVRVRTEQWVPILGRVYLLELRPK